MPESMQIPVENDLLGVIINPANLLYEGKGKKLYKIDSSLLERFYSKTLSQIFPTLLNAQNVDDKTKERMFKEILLCVFKDDLTAFNAQKKTSEKGKGELNCAISTQIFRLLESQHIRTHYIPLDSGVASLPNIMFCKRLEIIPLEVVVRNIATGSLVKRLGIKEKTIIKDTPLTEPLVEFYYKNDSLQDPIVTDSHCLLMGLANTKEMAILRELALKINVCLSAYFDRANLLLVDFKLEFGRDEQGNILLGDEISPDSCRLWDKATGKKMDKDRFREDLGDVCLAYREILERLLKLN